VRRGLFITFFSGSICLVSACALVIGIGDVPSPPSGDAGEAGSTADASDAGTGVSMMDAPPSDNYVPPFDANGCDACAAPVVPMGWSPAIFSTTNMSCPGGFSNLVFVKTSPTIQMGACTCSPSMQVAPVCDKGNLSVLLNCNGNTPQTIGINGPGCNPASVTVPNTWQASALAASNGGCSAMATADSSKLSATAGAICYPTGCPDDLCKGNPPALFKACIEIAGDVPCPNNDFPNKVAIADAYLLDCSSACTSCTATADCTNATLTLHEDAGCASFVTALNVDGQCHASGAPTAITTTAVYSVAVQNIKYMANGPLTAKAAPVNPKTLCCK
jgi:hypothetical protein